MPLRKDFANLQLLTIFIPAYRGMALVDRVVAT